MSFTAPSVDGQAEVVAIAQAFAGVDPATVSYVEAHGTATPLGDPIEIAALTQAFRAGTNATGFCAIGSVKSNIGHLDAAAGVAGLIKTAMALHHEVLPASLHFSSPNPGIKFEDTPFYVNAELSSWKRGPQPRRAGVSAFGVGGTNAHVVLEEAPETPPDPDSRADQLLVLSTRTEGSLAAATSNLARHLRSRPELPLADVAYTLTQGRRAFGFRRALVARDASEAATVLESNPGGRLLTGAAAGSAPAVVFLFPGQGAQRVGMTGALYRSDPRFRAELDACSEAFMPHLGLDIRSLVFAEAGEHEVAERRLAETAITQPALFAVEYALARLWMAWGVAPATMIGHSLGEYVAACLAGAFSLEDAATLVAARGRLMQEQPRGAMMAVRMPAAELEPRLEAGVVIAGLNAPALTVVSGPEAAVRELKARLEVDGIGCRALATSHAFHSPMMDGALEPFRGVLATVRLNRPRLPWVSCLTGDWITPSQAVDPEYWIQQLRRPVRFSEGVRLLMKDASHVLLEVGPGHTLGSMVRLHRDRPLELPVIASCGAEDDVRSVLEAAGRLWTSGVALDWPALHGRGRRRRVPLPTYPFERRRHWIDPPPLEGTHAEREASTVEPHAPEETAAAGRSRSDPAPPATVAETGVASRLRALLSSASGIPAGEIDPSRSFLEMGFDSLLLTQVSRALEKTLHVEVSFRQLLEDLTTPGALAVHIESSLAAGSPSGPGAPVATPPLPGARLGRDAAGNEAWFVPDPDRPGKYLQVTNA